MKVWDAIADYMRWADCHPRIDIDRARAAINAYQALYDAVLADDKYAITEAVEAIQAASEEAAS